MSSQEQQPWQLLLQVATLGEAQIVKSVLESEGVDVEFTYDATSSIIMGPGSVTPWSHVSIFVPADQMNKAAEVLESIETEED